MKTRYLVLGLLSISLMLLASGNAPMPYDDSTPPQMALPKAYEKALVALGSETNSLYCVGAGLGRIYSPEGGWQFKFYNRNYTTNQPSAPKYKYVTVDFDGKVYVSWLPGRFG